MLTIKSLRETTKAITGEATLSVFKLNSISRDHKSGTTAKDGRDYDAIKHAGRWYLTGDYTITATHSQ